MPLSLQVIDWAKGDSYAVAIEKMEDLGKELCDMEEEKRPHFVIAPYNDVYTNACIIIILLVKNGMLEWAEGKNMKREDGCNITVFTASYINIILLEEKKMFYLNNIFYIILIMLIVVQFHLACLNFFLKEIMLKLMHFCLLIVDMVII